MRIDPVNCKITEYTTEKAFKRDYRFETIDAFDAKGHDVHLIRWQDVCRYLNLNSGIIHGVINVHTYAIKLRRSNLGSAKFDPLFNHGCSTVMMVSINGLVKMITKMLENGRKIDFGHAEDLRDGLIHRFNDEIVGTYKVSMEQTSLDLRNKSKRQKLHDIARQKLALDRRIEEIMSGY